jgi:hypothetical protein
VSTEWFIVSLLRPVLVLLLLAGSSAAERVQSADRTLRTIDDLLGILSSDREHTLVGQGETQDGSDPLYRGDGPNRPDIGSRAVALGPNGIRLTRAARPTDTAPPPRHWRCAAPPTGPPPA